MEKLKYVHFNLERIQKPSQQRLLGCIVNALPLYTVRDKSHDMSMTSYVNGSVIILGMLMSYKMHAIVQLVQLGNPPVRSVYLWYGPGM